MHLQAFVEASLGDRTCSSDSAAHVDLGRRGTSGRLVHDGLLSSYDGAHLHIVIRHLPSEDHSPPTAHVTYFLLRDLGSLLLQSSCSLLNVVLDSDDLAVELAFMVLVNGLASIAGILVLHRGRAKEHAEVRVVEAADDKLAHAFEQFLQLVNQRLTYPNLVIRHLLVVNVAHLQPHARVAQSILVWASRRHLDLASLLGSLLPWLSWRHLHLLLLGNA